MTTQKYAFQGYDKEKMARVVGRDLSMSTKDSIEICSFIRGKKLIRAKELLENVAKEKIPVPYKRFTEGAGHRKGRMASGRYPFKASTEILMLLDSLEANAQQKGLNASALVIKHACAHMASRPPRYGRIRGRRAKRTHVELVAAEPEVIDAEKQKQNEKAEAKKPEAMPVSGSSSSKPSKPKVKK